jgi:hypothetical protein
MRIHLAGLAALAVLGAGFAAGPTSAATLAPVSKIHVAPSNDNDGTPVVDVSWPSVPAGADGVLVCLHRGISAIDAPDNCESQIAVATPALSSGPITFHPGKNYVIEAFSYQTTSPIDYSAPVFKVRHGVKVGLSSRCGAQTVGSTCALKGTLTDATSGARLANRKLQLWASKEKQPARWTLVGTKTTNSNGVARLRVTLDKTRLYQWHYASPRTRELTSSSSRVDIVVAR